MRKLQLRLDLGLRALLPEWRKSPPPICVPATEDEFWLLSRTGGRKLPVPPFGAAYSINRGLWGVTIGGKETLTSAGSIPDDAWVLSKDAFSKPRQPEKHTLHFDQGRPVDIAFRSRLRPWFAARIAPDLVRVF